MKYKKYDIDNIRKAIEEFYNSDLSRDEILKKYNITHGVFYHWKNKLKKGGEIKEDPIKEKIKLDKLNSEISDRYFVNNKPKRQQIQKEYKNKITPDMLKTKDINRDTPSADEINEMLSGSRKHSKASKHISEWAEQVRRASKEPQNKKGSKEDHRKGSKKILDISNLMIKDDPLE